MQTNRKANRKISTGKAKAKQVAAKQAAKASVKSESVSDEIETAKGALILVQPKAMQINLGGELLDAISAEFSAGDKIKELTGQRGYLRQEARAKATLGVFNVIQNDDGFDASAVYGSEKAWRDELSKLYVAMGVRNPDGTLTKRFAEAFPNPNANETEKASPAHKRRESLRNNIATLLKKATRAALALDEKGMIPSFDKEHHTLLIEGKTPATIAGKAGKPMLLTGEKHANATERASFEALMNIADKAHGKEKAPPAQKGGATTVEAIAQSAATDNAELQALVNAVIVTLTSLKDGVKQSQRKIIEKLDAEVSAFLQDAHDVD